MQSFVNKFVRKWRLQPVHLFLTPSLNGWIIPAGLAVPVNNVRSPCGFFTAIRWHTLKWARRLSTARLTSCRAVAVLMIAWSSALNKDFDNLALAGYRRQQFYHHDADALTGYACQV